MENSSKKINGLESARGLAALVVVAWHTSLGFYPGLSGIFRGFDAHQNLQGSPLYALINGTAAVVFFFVLSGYVLSRGFLISGDLNILKRNAIKRLPRLAFLTTSVCAISYFLFALELYRFEEAGRITQSPWLVKFAFAYDRPFDPNFMDALLQGLYRTFYFGESYYNSSMWSMKIEFFGSFLVFGTAALIGSNSRPLGGLVILALASSFALLQSPFYFSFVVGTALAWLIPTTQPRLGLIAALPSLILAFLLLGYTGLNIGFYKILGEFSGKNAAYLWIIASVFLILTIERSPQVRSFLNMRALRFLGEISFALYLVHVPVICSVGSLIYLVVGAGSASAEAFIAASISTVFVSIICAYVLTLANTYWLKQLNVATTAISSNRIPEK